MTGLIHVLTMGEAEICDRVNPCVNKGTGQKYVTGLIHVLTRGQPEICNRVNPCIDKGTARNMRQS